MGRNNGDFHEGRAPGLDDIKTAYHEGKVTLEEAHGLAGSSGEQGDNDLGEGYGLHLAGTPFGKAERSRKTARNTHKRAGLTVHPRKGY